VSESDFEVKDSGKREEFPSGMRRDTEDGKRDYTLIFDGPLADRYAEHMSKGARKYGEKNWMKAATEAEYKRFRRSAARHFIAWLRGVTDEDHAAATLFNIMAAEYVAERMASE